MDDQEAINDVAKQRREADAELAEWMRSQFEKMTSGQHQIPASEDPLDKTHFVLSEADFEWFQELLDNPPEPSEGLRKVMARKPPWE
jgi:hypothetical protein